jgi:hypothetical protein
MELYLHSNGNVINTNIIIANAMEKSNLGETSFHENDIFLLPPL